MLEGEKNAGRCGRDGDLLEHTSRNNFWNFNFGAINSAWDSWSDGDGAEDLFPSLFLCLIHYP